MVGRENFRRDRFVGFRAHVSLNVLLFPVDGNLRATHGLHKLKGAAPRRVVSVGLGCRCYRKYVGRWFPPRNTIRFPLLGLYRNGRANGGELRSIGIWFR